MEDYKKYIETITEIQDEIFNQELMIEKEENESKLISFLNKFESKHNFR